MHSRIPEILHSLYCIFVRRFGLTLERWLDTAFRFRGAKQKINKRLRR
jgi:hypothetical protein